VAFPLIFWNQIDNITLTATHRQRWMFYSLLGALAFQAVIDLALIPGRGAAGAGIGFALGEAALSAATLLAVSRLGINVQQALTTVAKLVPAAALVWLLARHLQQSSLLVACVLQVPAYALALLLFRVVTPHELHWIRDSISQGARGLRNRVAKDTLSAANCDVPECEGATSKP
jgi:O-antigen/teichoic acid export membrane protein